MATIFNILLTIDGAIYDLVDYIYDIFDFLAKINIFDNDMYSDITTKIYTILGLVMMFILAYTLLKAVINPDDYAKGEQSITKLIPNVLISLAIIVLLPTVFSFAMNFQAAVLNNDTIPNFILGETNQDNVEDGSIDNDNGRMISYYTFQAFLHPKEEYCVSEGMSYDECAASDKIKGNGALFVTNGDSYSEVDSVVRTGNSFSNYNVFGEAIRDKKMEYFPIISSIAGIFLLWVLLNYCFDMAIRVIKLAFYQLIAPIPVICRILPGGKMKDVFNNWTKQTISTYISVFIRIAIMSIGIFLLRLVIDAVDNNQIAGLAELRIDKKFIVIALLIMGIIIFIRQAPKLIDDIFHLGAGDMKLGLMDKLAMGGGLVAGGLVGGGFSSAVKNWNRTRLNKGSRWEAFKSAVGGLGSGAIRGAYNSRNAKNYGDLQKSIGVTTTQTAEAWARRRKRQSAGKELLDEQFEGQGWYDKDNFITNVAKGAAASVVGTGYAKYTALRNWATDGVTVYDAIINSAKEINQINDDFRNKLKKEIDKHGTDANLVAKMIEGGLYQFKGGEEDVKRMYELYDKFGFSHQGLAQIRDSIEKEKERQEHTDYKSLVEQQYIRTHGELKMPDKDSAKYTVNGVFDEATYNKDLADYNVKLNNRNMEIENMARQLSISDSKDAVLLDAIYNQIEKSTITQVGEVALKYVKAKTPEEQAKINIGDIKGKDLYDAGRTGQDAERIIKSSSIKPEDISVPEGSKDRYIKVDGDNYAKYIDDMAGAAKKQATNATYEKRKVDARAKKDK